MPTWTHSDSPHAGRMPAYPPPPASEPEALIFWLRREVEELKVLNLQMTHDYGVQLPDCEILAIYSTREEAEQHVKRVAGQAFVVQRLSSPWSKPLT